MADPVLVEVTRGDMVESRHRGAFAIVDAAGHVIASAGDIDRPVYARSAVKPVQALALVESGAAEAFGLNDVEIALACASHNGEAMHTTRVAGWLSRIGCTVADLECGSHPPYSAEAARTLMLSGEVPSALHNNCSGKHAGFLSVARHLGVPTAGYIRYDHPVQQRVLGIFEEMSGCDLGGAPRGIDGCGIPVIAIPLGNIALMMARLADPSSQPERRQRAAARIRRAMASHPLLIAGTGRYCSRVTAAANGAVLVKTGAEGNFIAVLPDDGIGIAVKIADGAGRAAEVAMGTILTRIGALQGGAAAALSEVLTPTLRNHAGRAVGAIRPAPGFPLAPVSGTG